MHFRILTICTGNICRSPLAHLLLEECFKGVPIDLQSAGTHALVGCPMPAPQLLIARKLGLNTAAEHSARQLTSAHLESVDLVLALSREHRSAAVQLNPSTLRRAFTLRELARIVQVVPDIELRALGTMTVVEKLRHAVDAAASYRGIALPPAAPEDDDVIDPYRRSQETYDESCDQVVDAVEVVIGYLKRSMV